jgi:hypothetical protein
VGEPQAHGVVREPHGFRGHRLRSFLLRLMTLPGARV